MEFQVIITPLAEQDLKFIVQRIAQNDTEIARRFSGELVFIAQSLKNFPQRHGTLIKRRNIRKLPYENYLIFYKIYENTKIVEILRFWHAARNQRYIRLREETSKYMASSTEIGLRRNQLTSGEGDVIPGDEILLQQAQSQQ